MKVSNTEILAPVGNWENLEAAVLGGANAVYLAGKNFGARSYAKNFNNSELIKVVNYCHIRNVSVYITVNTLIKESEINEVISYIEFLYSIDIDAIIIQDLGLASLLSRELPDLDLHASTQMTAHSLEDVKFLEKNGFSRVILSREVSIDKIREIKENTNVELEIFVHGALCLSYSGQCLMSSFIGGRSGNRGKCAQPCRKKYDLIDNETKKIIDNGNIISPKDLSTIEYIDELKKLNISSLKIEGRMKSKEYVYTVVKAYKESLSGNNLKRVFNRNFTKGFLFNESINSFITKDLPGNKGKFIGIIKNKDNNYIDIKIEEDIVLQDEIQIRRNGTSVGSRIEVILKDGKRVKTAKSGDLVKIKFNKKCEVGEKIYRTYDVSYVKEVNHNLNYEKLEIPLKFDVSIKIGEKPKLFISDLNGNKEEVTIDFIVQEANKKPVSKDQIKEKLTKLGNTPYIIEKMSIDCDKGVFLPVSKINELRRAGIDKINFKRKNRHNRKSRTINLKSAYLKEEFNRELYVKVSNLKHLKIALEYDIDGVYYNDIETYEKAIDMAKDKNIYLSLNNITSSDEYKLLKNYRERNLKFQISNIGQINFLKGESLDSNFTMNVFNSLTENFLKSNDIKSICLSPELTLDEMNEIAVKSRSKVSAYIYGYIPVMTTKYNFIKKSDNLSLKDSYNDEFRLKYLNKELLEVYNKETIFMLNNYNDLINSKIDRFILNITFEDDDLIRDIIKSHLLMTRNKIDKEFITIRDRYKNRIKQNQGHFYKGVE